VGASGFASRSPVAAEGFRIEQYEGPTTPRPLVGGFTSYPGASPKPGSAEVREGGCGSALAAMFRNGDAEAKREALAKTQAYLATAAEKKVIAMRKTK
jgi:hypothetical protein